MSELRNINVMITNSIKNDYKSFWSNRLRNIKIDNDIYKQIKSISNYKNQSKIPDTLISDNNETFSSDKQKCEALACQFAKTHELTKNTQSEYETLANETYEQYDKQEPIMNFTNRLTADFKNKTLYNQINQSDLFLNTNELKAIIKSRKNKKSSGCDTLPNYALKRMSTTFILYMTIFMNHITNIQYVPNAWKTGIVTPLPKPGKDTKNVKNWRPVTQLPSISKCYEKHIDNKIREHCDRNKLLDPNQFGFRPSRSTTNAIAKFSTQVTEGSNNKTPTFAVLLDLQAAFDVIWHKGLIYKLHQMNFDPAIIRLSCNYLKDRYFSVKYQNQISNKKQVPAGCQQGKILAATFFLLYLNDLPRINNAILKINRLLYADDIIIFRTSKNVKYVQQIINTK